MTHFITNWWGTTPPVQKLLMLMAVLFLAYSVFSYVRYKIRKKRLESFLFNNNYHSLDPKSNEVIFPKVIFRKNQVIIKNCLRKTRDLINEDREIWERVFHSEFHGKKIGAIEGDGTIIRMALD